MTDIPDPPDPVEMPDFKFTALRQIKLGDDSPLPDSMGLLAMSTKGGLLYAGVGQHLHIINSKDVEQQDNCGKSERGTENEDFVTNKVKLPGNILHVGISCDNLIVSVVVELPIFPILYLFDSRGLQESEQPFAEVCLNTTVSGVSVSQVAWNPAIPNMFSVSFVDGSFAMYTVKGDGVVDCQTLPPASGIIAVSWSPKGKQIAAVKKNGCVTQYKPDLKEAKTYEGPPNLPGHAPVSIFWVSTYEFMVGYLDTSDPASRPGLWLIKGSKTGPTTYSFFDDVTYSMGEDRRKRFDCLMIPEWNYIVVASSNSVELAVLKQEGDSWRQGLVEDCGRAEIPLSKSNGERYPAGLVLNQTAERETPVGEGFEAPSPLLHVLSSDGHLVSFSCVNTKPGASDQCTPSVPLPTEDRRPGTVKYPETKLDAVPPPSYAQSTPIAPAKAQVPFGSGIFNPGATSFLQSTPVKPATETAAPAKPSSDSLFKPPETSSMAPFGSATPFSGFGKPKEMVPSPLASLAKLVSSATTPLSLGTPSATTPSSELSTPAPVAVAPAVVKPVPAVLKPVSAAIKPVLPVQTGLFPKESTPPAAKPVVAAVSGTTKKNLDRKIDLEFGEFDRKLAELKVAVANFSVDIGTQEEKVNLVTRTEALKRFGKEVLDTTTCQAKEIGDLKVEVADTANWLEEARTRNQESGAHKYNRMIRSKPLDPRCARKMVEVTSLYNYLELQVDEANNKLDMEWEERKHQRGTRLNINQEDIFTALLNNHKIVEEQKIRVAQLSQELRKIQLNKPKRGGTSAVKQNRGGDESDAELEIRKLAETFRDKSKISAEPSLTAVTPKTPKSGKLGASVSPVKVLTPDKDAALRKLLEARKTVSVVKPKKHDVPGESLLVQSPEETKPGSSLMLNKVREAEQKSRDIQQQAAKAAAVAKATAAKTVQKTLFENITPTKEPVNDRLSTVSSPAAGFSLKPLDKTVESPLASVISKPTPTTAVNSAFAQPPASTASTFSSSSFNLPTSSGSAFSFTPVSKGSAFTATTTGTGKKEPLQPLGGAAATSSSEFSFSSATSTSKSTFLPPAASDTKSEVASKPGFGFSTPSTDTKPGFGFTTATTTATSKAPAFVKPVEAVETTKPAQAAKVNKIPAPSGSKPVPSQTEFKSAATVDKPGFSFNTAASSTPASAATTAVSSAPSAGSSIFGGSATTVESTKSVFGGSTSSSTHEAPKSVFGGATSSGSSLFGAAAGKETSPAAPSSSIFAASAISTGSSIFGGTSSSTATTTATDTKTEKSSSVFGAAKEASPAPTTTTPSGSIFAGGKAASGSGSIFGGSSSSAFGAVSSEAPSTATSGGSGLFGKSTTAASPFAGSSSSSSSMFGGSSATTVPATSSSIFGGGSSATASPFGAATAVSSTSSAFGNAGSGSIFGGGAGSSGSVFGGAAATPASSAGGGSIFGGGSTGTSTSGSFFSSSNSAAPPSSGSIFGGAATTTTASSGGGGGIFGGSTTAAAPSSSIFGGGPSSSTSSPFGGGGGSSIFGGGSSSGGGGGGFLSGLGSSETAASPNKNPFGASSFGSAPSSSASLFGGSSSTGFGQSTSQSTFGGAFSAGSASQGFGAPAQTTPAKPTSGFGAAPAFGSPPAFGSSAGFGTAPAFGSSTAFGSASAFGASSAFGGAASNAPTFGQAAGGNAGGGTFGGLAGSSGGSTFGGGSAQPSAGFGGFGGAGGSGGGSSPPPAGAQFNSWR